MTVNAIRSVIRHTALSVTRDGRGADVTRARVHRTHFHQAKEKLRRIDWEKHSLSSIESIYLSIYEAASGSVVANRSMDAPR